MKVTILAVSKWIRMEYGPDSRGKRNVGRWPDLWDFSCRRNPQYPSWEQWWTSRGQEVSLNCRKGGRIHSDSEFVNIGEQGPIINKWGNHCKKKLIFPFCHSINRVTVWRLNIN
jgi:hypothetical protein